jgi:histidine phosphotransferase ChpT
VDDLRLSALLCTRLCHDLIGPAGAVVNGVELLTESPGAVDQEVLELIRHSAAETTRRLKYFRAALGMPSDGLSLAAARAIADDYFAAGKIVLDWSDRIMETPASLPPRLVPIILNLVLCAAESLPRGGRIAIDGAPDDGGFTIRIKAVGESIKADDDALLSLSGDRDLSTLDARGLVPYMAARLVSAAGGKIDTTPSAGSMEFSVTLRAAP